MTYYFVEDVWEQSNDDSIREDSWYYIVEDICGYPKEDSIEKKTSSYYVSMRIVVPQQDDSKIYSTFTVTYLISWFDSWLYICIRWFACYK